MLAAHADCGLLLREGREGDFAYAFPALSPWKVGGAAHAVCGARYAWAAIGMFWGPSCLRSQQGDRFRLPGAFSSVHHAVVRFMQSSDSATLTHPSCSTDHGLPPHPRQDMEVCVHGSSMASPAFQRLLFTALRALIDELGVATFNAAIYNIDLAAPSSGSSGSSVVSGMGGSAGSEASSSSSGGSSPSGGSVGLGQGPPGASAHPRGMALPVVARVVSRGKLSNMASDFGGLEVFGGASIGHTDPFRVAEALQRVQERLPAM